MTIGGSIVTVGAGRGADLLISQGNYGLRKITRSLCLDFATFTWTRQSVPYAPFVRFSFLILIGRFVTLEP
jgi:hypothetical protein